jgi:hypothetical protein
MTRGRLVAGRRGGRPTLCLCLGAGLLGALLTFAMPGAAQEGFRTTFEVKSRDASAILLDGRVVNNTGGDVVDVWVTAEAVSASGKVLARGIAFVGSVIARGASAPFEVKLPGVAGAQTFRVAVSSFRAGSETQSP